MVAIGIGLHNLGEGLAIGSAYAIGSLALGAFLVIGFAIHNTTEGLAIVAPLAREKETAVGRADRPRPDRRAPRRSSGAVIGASVYNQELATFLIGIGVGAIVQVIVQLRPVDPRPAGQRAPPAQHRRHRRRRGRPLPDRPAGLDLMPAVRAHNAHPRGGTLEGAENYAKAIYQLQARGEGAVGTGAVAERLGVTPASASAMLKRLADEGLVELRARTAGARLTGEGEQVALEMIRHHRLIELFLAEVLGMPWDRVHEEAEVLEHHISEELEELIAAKLGEPARDPHGDPIPGRELAVAADETVSLAELETGADAVFERVSDSDPEMLRYLDSRGIRPGAELRVTGREPFEGPISVRTEDDQHALGLPLARAMRVSSGRD